MHSFFQKIFQIYTWLIIIPFSWVITAFIAILTFLFSYVISPRWASKWIAPLWGKWIIWITFSRVKVHGKENIGKNQSYIIICNHQSLYDTITIYGYLPLEFKWVMKKELERMPFVGMSCKALGHVFVDRGNSEKAKTSLLAAKDKIKDGVSAFFFPEGTRSKDGQLTQFKKGAFRMAKDLELPILPVTISGANKVMAFKSLVILPGTINLTIHPMIELEQVASLSNNELSKKAKSIIASAL